MPAQFIVIEVKGETEVGKIVESIKEHTSRLAIVDEVPGIFDNINVETTPSTRPSRALKPKKRRSAQVEDGPATEDTEQAISTLNDDGFPEGLKENLRFALDSSMFDDSFVDADSMDDSVVRTLRKRSQRDRDDGETALSVRRKVTESTLICGLCKSKMTLRASYGRTRLREHVMRHLNMPTAQCGHCDFKGVLREHARRHYILKHKDVVPNILELEPTEDYNSKFDELWKICFPTTTQIQPRMTSQRARAHEAHYYENVVKIEDDGVSRGPCEAQSEKPAEDLLATSMSILAEFTTPNDTARSEDIFYETREPPLLN